MRSKYERQFAIWCDRNDDIVWWSSENIVIKYYHPIKKRVASYYPDFCICVNNKIIVIELKPKRECSTPKYSKRKSYLNEQAIYLVNKMKWEACKKYCERNNWQFIVITNESIIKK